MTGEMIKILLIAGHQRPASEITIEGCFAGMQMMALYLILNGGLEALRFLGDPDQY